MFRLMLLFLLASYVHAGTETGGGGDVVILPDGSVVLADVFLDRNAPQPGNMPKQIALNPKVIYQIKTYTNFTRLLLKNTKFITNKESDILKLLDVLSHQDNDLAFYSVANAAELKDFCASGGRKIYKLENGAEVEQVACTAGLETYLVQPLYRRMHILQQTLLLYHERLTTLRDKHGGKNYQAIAGFTSGLFKILELSYEQQQGKFRKLTELELERVRGFYEAVFELEYRSSEVPEGALNFHIHPFGGGMVKAGAEIDEAAFLGVTSMIEEDVSVSAGAFVMNASLSGKIEIEENARLTQVLIEARTPKTFVRIGKDASIAKTTFGFDSRLEVGERTKIENSIIEARSLVLGDDVEIVDSEIKLHLPNSKGWDLNIKSGQKMIRGTMTGPTMTDYAPEGIPLKTFSEKFSFRSKCEGTQRQVSNIQFGPYEQRCYTHRFSTSEERPSQRYEFEGGELNILLKQDIFKAKNDYLMIVDRGLEGVFETKALKGPVSNKNFFMVYQNEFRPVGDYRMREVAFPKNVGWAATQLDEALTSILKEQVVDLKIEPGKYTFRLRYEE